MKSTAKFAALVFGLSLTLLSCSTAFSQDQEISEATSATPIAHVYIQVTNGVNVYSESAAGKLTLVKGSPFKISGQMEGITGSHLLSVGTTLLHSYQLAPNGAVGGQIASISTAEYDSDDCGPTTGSEAVLDHSGRYFYVQLFGGPGDCGGSDLQTYQIGSNGGFTFIGNLYTEESGVPLATLVVDSSDKYAYSFLYDLSDYTHFQPFTDMNDLAYNSAFSLQNPAADPSSPNYLEPYLLAPGPDEQLAVLLVQCPIGDDVCNGASQLASYTIDPTTGGISSTNTQDNAPTLEITPIGIDMSYDGKFVAIGGGSGIQVFNFNGAAVPTQLSPLKLSEVQIDQVRWDKAGHLFALSYESQELYVFNVSTAHGLFQIGEPISVHGAYGLTGIIVVNK
jgi:hypothetical protein